MIGCVVGIASAVLLALVFPPVLHAQVLSSKPRRLTGVSLDEVSYEDVTLPR